MVVSKDYPIEDLNGEPVEVSVHRELDAGETICEKNRTILVRKATPVPRADMRLAP